MKAIILAAGQGKRLRPLTQFCPKGMVKIHDKSIIDRQIELFHEVGIHDILIVKGYQSQNVHTQYAVKYYENPDYQTTNMLYSLFCAEDELNDDVIISYGDILYSKHVLQKLLSTKDDFSVIVDMNWETYFKRRFDDPYEDAESLVVNDKFEIRSIGQANPEHENVQAQYIGLFRIQNQGIEDFKNTYQKACQSKNNIGWGKQVRNAYMTDMLQELINQGHTLQGIKIYGEWLEIDSLRDYELAVEMLNVISG